jgi:hypothetical protein
VLLCGSAQDEPARRGAPLHFHQNDPGSARVFLGFRGQRISWGTPSPNSRAPGIGRSANSVLCGALGHARISPARRRSGGAARESLAEVDSTRGSEGGRVAGGPLRFFTKKRGTRRIARRRNRGGGRLKKRERWARWRGKDPWWSEATRGLRRPREERPREERMRAAEKGARDAGFRDG